YDTNKSNPENSLAHYYKLVYYCEKISGNLTTSIETSSVAFFDVKNLPELSTKRNTKKQIIECFENRHNKTIIERLGWITAIEPKGNPRILKEWFYRDLYRL